MSTALLVGYYGQHNAGDDALLVVSTAMARQCLGATEVLATAPRLPRTYGHAVRPLYCRWPGRIARMLNWGRLRRTAPEVRHVIFGGGSNFHTEASIRRWIRIVRSAGGGPHAAIGVSLGPFRTLGAEGACAELLGLLHFVGVRDRASYARGTRLAPMADISLTFDLAPLLPLAAGVDYAALRRADERRAGRRLGIALCHYERFVGLDPGPEESRLIATAAAVRAAAQATPIEEVVILDFNGHPVAGDAAVGRALASRLRHVAPVRHVSYEGDPIALMTEISRLRGLLAMRLHAAVFGFCCGVPVALVTYHEKCGEWADRIGLPQRLRIPSHSPEVGRTEEAIQALLADQPPALALGLEEACRDSRRNLRWHPERFGAAGLPAPALLSGMWASAPTERRVLG